MKVILVGAGKWGAKIACEAHKLNVLVAIVDESAVATSRTHDAIGAPSSVQKCSNVNDALEAFPQAAVIVATPPHTHHTVARCALEASRDVWVEKPLCDTVDHADELVKLSHENGTILFTDHLMQYNRAHRALLNAVKSGWVGKVTRVRGTRVNFGTVRTVENVLWSFCPHDISLILAVLDGRLPERVNAMGQCVVSADIEDYVDIHLEYADGTKAALEASWLHYEKERRLVVYGTEGCIIVNESQVHGVPELQGFKWSTKRNDDKSVAIDKREDDVSRFVDELGPVISPLNAALQHFIECCETRASPRTDGAEGLRVLQVLMAAQKSLERREAVRMKDVAPVVGAVKIAADKKSVTSDYFKHRTAVVDDGAMIGANTKIWHFSHIMSGATVGEHCNVGQNVYVAGKAVLGNNVKVQNGVSIYDGVTVENDVFLGPHCTFTNVKTPRSHVNRRDEWLTTVVRRGATIGANATVVCGCSIGAFAFVGAGAVVTKNIPDYAMVYGNPARIHAWVSRLGLRMRAVSKLADGQQILECPETNERYFLTLPSDAHRQPLLQPAHERATDVDPCKNDTTTGTVNSA